MDLKEFLIFMGCMSIMACYIGSGDREEWWSSDPIEDGRGAPMRLNKYMCGRRFQEISTNLVYTNKVQPTTYVDPFFEVRQMEEEFNSHYELN